MEALCICFKYTQHPLLHVEQEQMGNVMIVTLAARLLISAASVLSYNKHSSHTLLSLTHTQMHIFHALASSVDQKLRHPSLIYFVVSSDRSPKQCSAMFLHLPRQPVALFVFCAEQCCCLIQTGWAYFRPEGTGSSHS